MPPSRYVSAGHLMRMLLFVAGAVLVLVAGDAGLRLAGVDGGMRRGFVWAWLVGVPLVGWRVWRGSAPRSGH